MKKRIIDIGVIIVMAIIANYSIYKNFKSTAEDINLVIQTVQAEVISWQEEVEVLKERLNVVQSEFHRLHSDMKQTIDSNLAVADSTLKQIDHTLGMISDSTLAQVNALRVQTEDLQKQVNQVLRDIVDESNEKVKKKVKRIIPGLPGF